MRKRDVERAMKRVLKAKQEELQKAPYHDGHTIKDLYIKLPMDPNGVPRLLVGYTEEWTSRRGNPVRKRHTAMIKPLFCPFTGQPVPQED